MAKVLLVEDDNNLREIYEARLQAEGYDIVSASDGEQALVVAKDAKPDLVISDVMMPKISGFEMLDILRNTDGMQDVKVIMLTALGQGEDKDRADQLGADKYLVKSQVTLEDIVATAHQLLDDAPAPAPAEPTAAASDDTASTATAPSEPVAVTTPTPAPAEPVAAAPTPEPAVVTDTPAPVTAPEPVATAPATESTATPAAPVASSPASDEAASEADEQAAMQQQINDFANQPAAATQEVAPAPAAPAEEAAAPSATEPTAPAEPAAAASTEQQHDAILNEAVDSLNAATDSSNAVPNKPSDVTAVEVPPEPAAAPSAPATPPPAEPAATPDPAPAAAPTPTAQPEPTQPSAAPTSDGVAIAGKKIIQPLSGAANDATGASKPDLNELLAREEAKTPTPTEPAIPAEQQPPAPATPAPAAPAPAANDTVDPNSIAL